MAMSLRGPKHLQQDLLDLGPVAAARKAVLARRAVEGANLKQADVDLVAEALIRAAVRPYPRAVVAVIGGSLSTMTPMFDDWWQRFAMRQLDPDTPGLDASSKISLQFRHLVAQWEAVLREHLTGVADPNEVLIAAAKLGEQQALRMQLTAVAAERDRLLKSLEAMTYRVAALDARIQTEDASAAAAQAALSSALTRLNERLDHSTGLIGKRSETRGLAKLTAEVRQLRQALARPTSKQTVKRRKPPQPPKSSRARVNKKSSRGTRQSKSRRSRRGR